MAEYMGRPAMLWETPTLAARTKEGAAHVAHRQAGDGVVAHSDADGYQEGDEDQALLKHAEGAGAEAHHKDHDGDQQLLPFGGFLDDASDARLNGLGLRHNSEGAANDEDKGGNIGGFDQALLYGHQSLHRSHRGLLDAVVAAVHQHLHAVLIHVGFVLARGNHTGQNGTYRDDEQEQREHVGDTDTFFLWCHL